LVARAGFAGHEKGKAPGQWPVYRIRPDAAPVPTPWRWSGTHSWSPQRWGGRSFRPRL